MNLLRNQFQPKIKTEINITFPSEFTGKNLGSYCKKNFGKRHGFIFIQNFQSVDSEWRSVSSISNVKKLITIATLISN